MKNVFTFKDKALIFPLVIGFILAIIIISIGIVFYSEENTIQKKNEISPTPAPVNTSSVTHVVPDEPQPIDGGIPHTFLVYFNQNVSIKDFTFSLYYTDITQSSPQKIPQGVSFSLFAPKTIAVKTENPIKERSEYTLMITDAKTGKVLSQTNYLSGEIQPTPIPSNNTTLKNYLPYETNSYSLEYLANQNLYIFHFKYDPSNDESIQQQYADAKNQATQFIESKGVDINSIVIQYRSS